MASRKHKRQHFVPAGYLRAWCDPGCPAGQAPYIWLFPKGSATGRRRAPKNVFTEADFYTLVAGDGSRDLKIEHFLSRLEGRFVTLRREKLDDRRPLLPAERILLCFFTAVMHARSRQLRDHLQDQWGSILKSMEAMGQWAQNATPEQLRPFSSASEPTDDRDVMTIADVRAIVERPVQFALRDYVAIEAPLLRRMSMAVLCTADPLGFITSDAPCVWVDPAFPDHPPGLGSRSIEVTLPLSPACCLLLTWSALSGYLDASTQLVGEINRRTRFNCDSYYVVKENRSQAQWFSAAPTP